MQMLHAACVGSTFHAKACMGIYAQSRLAARFSVSFDLCIATTGFVFCFCDAFRNELQMSGARQQIDPEVDDGAGLF